MKRRIGNVLATLAAVAAGLVTLWASVKYLKEPQGAIDWVVLILSGITTGTLAFFVIWGHFQDEPVVAEGKGAAGFPVTGGDSASSDKG